MSTPVAAPSQCVSGRYHPFCPPLSAPVMHLAVTAQYPIKGRLTCQINALIRQAGHYLRGGQARIRQLMTHLPYLRLFLCTEAICRGGPYGPRTTILPTLLPPPPGAQAEVDFPTGDNTSGSGCHGFINPQDELLTLISRGQSSSSVSP